MKKWFKLLARLCLAVTLAPALLAPAAVSAFSAYGSGTSVKPFRISTCAQLEEIDNDLAGYYTLVANIDCAGVSFSALASASAFTGSLDGLNHTIKNITITGGGLFTQTNGAVIKNLSLSSGSLTSTGTVGSFVSTTYGTTLTNVHSAITIYGSGGSNNGGLVGLSYDNLNISSSSYSGTITSSVYSGGLVGLIYDTGTNLITNSFFNGTFNLVGTTTPSVNTSYANGGLVGLMYGGTISNSYSAGTINYDTGGNGFGGLVGLTYDGVFNNNFVALSYSGSSPNTFGAAFGLFYTGGAYSATRTNIYYDQYLANSSGATLACVGFDQGSGNCTAVNAGNASPGYFKNNSSNGSFGTWDFSSVWETTSGYPTLRNISSFSTSSSDQNADGIDDSFQANIVTVPDGNNILTSAVTPSSNGCTLGNGYYIDANYIKIDSGYTPQPPNMLAFKAYCPTAGMTIPVTIIYDRVYDTSNSVLRYFNDSTNTYSTVTGATFGTLTVSGTLRTAVTYNITDGGQFDGDGLSNGLIEDPVGIAISSSSASANQASAPNTGLLEQSMALFYASIIAGAGLVFSQIKHVFKEK